MKAVLRSTAGETGHNSAIPRQEVALSTHSVMAFDLNTKVFSNTSAGVSRMAGADLARVWQSRVVCVKARVKDGRFEPEEPMDLPDGTVVHLTVDVEEEFSEEDRRALEASLRRGIEDVKAGRVHSSEEVHALLKARVHSSS